jgi:hypothetical protein
MKAIGVLVAMLVGFAVLALGAYKYDTSHTEDKVIEAEKALQTDIDANLRPGASPKDVDAILDAHGIGPHTYLNYGVAYEQLRGGTGAEVAMQGPYGNMMHQCTLVWSFFFDRADRYISDRSDARCKNTLTTGTHDWGTPMRPGVDEPVPDPYSKTPPKGVLQ